MSRFIHIKMPDFASNATALEAALAGRLGAAKLALRDAVTETAAETANALADRTFPKGYGFKLAKDSMLFELASLYATGGRVYKSLIDSGEQGVARAFYHAYKSGDLSAASRELRRSHNKWASVPVEHLDPALHERSRNPVNGHIEVKFPLQIVPVEELAAYQNLAIKRLGKTASGWNACAEQLGGDGNKPPWKGTAMHGSDGGLAGMQETATGFEVRLLNKRKLARKHLSPGQVRSILRAARKKLNDRLVTGKVFKLLRGKRAA